MVMILEKYEQNIDFHQIVDFVGASHIRYALTFNPTIYVSYIRQFWSTARIDTTDEGTKILATVDGILRTVTESLIKRNLKLNDEERLSSLPDTELFENLTLMGYNISPNQKFTFQKGFNEFSSNIATALVCLATNRTYNFSKMIFDGLVENVNNKVSKFLMYPRARIAQSLALSPVADEPASPMRDVSQGEACPTDSGFVADQDRANIAKTSTLPHESTSRVTSLAADKGSINLSGDDASIKGRRLDEEEVATKRVSSDTEEIRLDEGEVVAERVSDDTEEMAIVLIKMDAASVLSSGGVQVVPTAAAVAPANVSISTGSGVVPTTSTTISTATPIFATATTFARELEEELEREAQRMNAQIARDEEIAKIHAEEELQQMIEVTPIPTVTSSETTPLRQYTQRARIAQSSALPPVANEPASPMRDVSQGEACPTDSGFVADQDTANIAKTSTLPNESTSRVTSLAVDEGTQALEITELKARVKFLEDRQGEGINLSGDDAPIKRRRLDEGEVATERVSDDIEEIRWDEREVEIERVSDDTEEMATVLMTMDAASILSSGGVQVVPTTAQLPLLIKTRTKKQKRDFYMAVIRNNLGWKVKDFKGMYFEEVEAKFKTVWKQMEDFIPIGSKEEGERIKRKGLNLEHESAKKQKTSKDVPEEAMSPEEVTKEKVNEMIQLVPIEEVYAEALQVKHPIIDWRVYTEEQKSYWKITRLGGIDWKLYDSCGVHHVTSTDKEIFMLVEKDYPLRKGLALVMICYKLQVENFSQMANDLVLKIYKIANSLRQQGD
uniref:Synaptobrevin, longin-like domain protein n=1 Tax=Tanacetum cinerariifolium TaxID=118510 RepID=A0A6L2LGF0_TANCI|nr:hypothetical protein [Tanacetum cinerariifolium]